MEYDRDPVVRRYQMEYEFLQRTRPPRALALACIVIGVVGFAYWRR